MREMNKVNRKILAVILSVAMIITAMSATGKISKAADYASALILPITSSWGEELYLTESSGGEQWYKILIPSDGNYNMKIMKY